MAITTTISPTRVLADFAAGLTIDRIPIGVRERVKDLLLDALASALAGHETSESAQVAAVARTLMGGGRATVIGGGYLSIAAATLANGYLITAATVCDIHRPTSCHVTPEVVPPTLAMGEHLDASGADILVAIAVGCELTTRIGLGINWPAFRSRGWHAPGVTGVFGAAAATGRLHRLDAERMIHALGIAGSQAAGSYAQVGTPTIKFNQSRAAVGGLMAAQLAAEGFTAAEEILVHPDGGLYFTHSDGGSPDVALSGLGVTWELEQISLRPWSVGARLQTPVSLVLDLALEQDIRPADVRCLRIRVSPSTYRLHGLMDWSTRFRAKVSLRYVTSVVLHDRLCWVEQFTTERVADPAVGEFALNRVEVLEDPRLGDRVEIEIERMDRTSLTAQRAIAHGDACDPLSRPEIEGKFRMASSRLLTAKQTEGVIAFVAALEQQPGLRPLMDALRYTGRGRRRQTSGMVAGLDG